MSKAANVFNNSRCSEILDSCLSKAGGPAAVEAAGRIPLEAQIIVMLTIKMQVIALLDPSLSEKTLEEHFSQMHLGFATLIPELYTEKGQALYTTLAEVFTRDMKDLKNGRF